MKIKLPILLLFVLSTFIHGQSYTSLGEALFLNRMSSAKAEAMGKILSLDYDSYYASQANPAAITQNKSSITLVYSKSSPYYLLKDGSVFNGGIIYNNSKLGSIAINSSVIYFGKYHLTTEHSPEIIRTINYTNQIHTLTYSKNIKMFKFGINANIFFEDREKTYKGTYFGFGLLKNIKVYNSNDINYSILIGSQFTNVFNQGIKWKGVFLSFPTISRIGLSNNIEFIPANINNDRSMLSLQLGYEYQDLLNSKYKTMQKLGFELGFLEMVFIRGGYYSEKIIECVNCKRKNTDFRFGFGAKIRLKDYINKIPPITIAMDYINTKQPSSVVDMDFKNFSTINMMILYDLK